MREFRDPLASWTPPEELAGPTPSPAKNLALVILQSSVVGNDLIELIGNWISAMARLNMWYKDPDRRSLRQGEYPRLLVLQGNVADTIWGAWQAYLFALKESEGISEYESLLNTVREGVRTIRDAMEQPDTTRGE